jgi:hypothetical protein
MSLPEFMPKQLDGMYILEPINVEAARELLGAGILPGDLLCVMANCHELKKQQRAQLYRRLEEYVNRAKDVKGAGWCVKVKYVRSEGYDFGRLVARGPSLQNFPRPIRHLLTHGVLYDVDIDCCHPTIMWQYAAKLGVPESVFAPIKSYADNSKPMRETVAADLGITMERSKKLWQRVCNAGAMALENGDDEPDTPVSHALLLPLQKAARECMAAICKANPATLELCKAKKNPEISCMSCVLQGFECGITGVMYKHSKALGHSPRALMHDGFMPQL